MNLLASNRRCSDPNLNETWQEHLRSEARTAETEPEENHEQAACCNTHHPETSGSDERIPNEGLLNGKEHADSEIENGILLANQDTLVVGAPCLAELSNEAPEQNGEDLVRDSVLDHSTGESVTSIVSPSSPPTGPVTTNQECLSPKRLASNLELHLASSQEDSTEPLNTPSSLHSPSHPLSPKANTDSFVCNSEFPRLNGSLSQKSLSRQTSTASAGSLQLGCHGRAPAQGTHLGEDGLSVHRDAVQVRLRQMEAGHQLQVETLKRQVQALLNKLHVSGELVRKQHACTHTLFFLLRFLIQYKMD